MAHAGGSPTKYKEEYIEEVDKYISSLNDTEVPLKEDFAYRLGVDDDTLDNWANAKDEEGKLKHPEFFGALKRITQKQKIQLINDGIYGGKEVNPTITKLMLMNNHGMREKTDFTSDDDKIQTIDITAILNKVYGDKSGSSTNMPTDS